MKRVFLILFNLNCFVQFSYTCVAQTSIVSGNLQLENKKYFPLRIILTNKLRSDSVTVDSTFNFTFYQVPYGIYQLNTETNTEVTGLKHLTVTDIEITEDSVHVFPIKLFKFGVCERGQSFMLGKKRREIYYKSGELFGIGDYKKKRKYYREYKARLWCYEKQGKWNFYYKSGKLLSEAIYESDHAVSFRDFYENGQLKLEGHYSPCKFGKWIYYSEDGSIIFEILHSRLSSETDFKYLQQYMENYQVETQRVADF